MTSAVCAERSSACDGGTVVSVSGARMRIAELVNQAEAIIEYRERQEPVVWAMTAFSRYRLVQLLNLEPIASDDSDLRADPIALLEEATSAVEQQSASAEGI